MNPLQYLEPVAKQAIDHCKKEDGKLITSILGYQTEKEALNLLGLLHYARNQGVAVIFAEDSKVKCVQSPNGEHNFVPCDEWGNTCSWCGREEYAQSVN